MIYTVEESLRNFKFWSGGKDRADKCSIEELDSIEEFLEEIAPEDGWTDTGINDTFWFEFDSLAQHLGYENEEDFDLHHDPNYLDDDELVECCSEWFHELINSLKQNRDEKSWNILGDIAYECFDYYCEIDESVEEYGEDNYDYLSTIHDNQIIFDALFEDNRGHDACNIIPTLKQFRQKMMLKFNKSQQ